MKKGFLKKGDAVAFCAVLAAGVALLLIFNFAAKSGSCAEISVNGEVCATLDLNKDSRFEIKNESGEITNIAVASGGKVHMEYADCPDQICVKHAEISKKAAAALCACRIRLL
ncbi:MAG: NusG domain II-containing protein [Anaerotruncus sp.]|nr:MAG: NusG domain II-containing protein [Anaerotruncus sp.]